MLNKDRTPNSATSRHNAKPTRTLRTRALSPLLAFAALSWACTDPSGELAGPDEVGRLLVRANAAATTVNELVVEVTAPDISPPLYFNIELDGTVASGTITVPVGSDRTITIRAYDASDIETHRGVVTLNITEGENAPAMLTLLPLSGDQPIEVSVGSWAVIVSPSELRCWVAGSRQFEARVLNAAGETISANVRWATTRPAVASISDSGLVEFVGTGTATIAATIDGVVGLATVEIAPEPSPDARNVTFFFTADPQYAKTDNHPNWFGRNQERDIRQMNVIPDKLDPICGRPIDAPRGVLVAGDLTQNGWEQSILPNDKYGELDLFLEQFGYDGTNGLLNFPVFEGYGNHDNDLDGNGVYCGLRAGQGVCNIPVVDAIRKRNNRRIADGLITNKEAVDNPLIGPTTGGLHYSWDWDDVHFVNLNEFAGADGIQRSRTVYARNSLRFLREDLERVGTQRPIIIMQHYGFNNNVINGEDSDGLGWTCSQVRALAQATKDYNVIAYLSGHAHQSWGQEVIAPNGAPAYISGAAREDENHANTLLGFLVIRLLDDQFHIMERWRPRGPQADTPWRWRSLRTWSLPLPELTANTRCN